MFVKICGITSEADALLAVALGADAVGFVFAPSSRQIAPTQARDIARRLPPEILTVGVFRDEAPSRVVEIVHQAGLRAAQLHGHESAADSRYVAERVSTVIKAFPGGHPDLARVDEFGAAAVLIDSATPGSGQVFDWALAEGAPLGKRVILAGGLDPDNVESAIEAVAPWGVDVSTGVESAPGRKDPRLMRTFIERAKAAERPAERPAGDDEPYDWQEDETW